MFIEHLPYARLSAKYWREIKKTDVILALTSLEFARKGILLAKAMGIGSFLYSMQGESVWVCEDRDFEIHR